MTFDQIKYFISVVEHNTFFEAAENLNISQSALSKQIIKLEKLPLILMNRYTSVFKFCTELFHSYGMEPNIIRTGRVETIISAVSIGVGVSLLPQSNFEIFHHDNVSVIPLEQKAEIPVVMCMKKSGHMTPAANKFIHFFQNYHEPQTTALNR